MNRKRVVILGATGSIGESALKVARDIPERMEIVGLAANSNAEKLAAAANELRPESLCLVDETEGRYLRESTRVQAADFFGEAGLRRDRLPDECGHGAGRNRRHRRFAARARGD